jgi:hypothetical protein
MDGTSFCPGCGAPTAPLTEICTNCGAQVAKAIKRKTWKPTVAGILCIIAGAIGVITVIAVAILFGSISFVICAPLIIFVIIQIVGGIYALRRRIWRLALAGSIFALIVPVILVTFAMLLLAAALSEGLSPLPTIPAMLARIWYLIVGFGIPGILAIIFVIMGKGEFK